MVPKIKSFKFKVALILACFLVMLGIVNFLVAYCVLYPSFLTLEQVEAKKNLTRAVDAIRNDISYLGSLCHDWAAWDDTYAFMETGSVDYINATLSKSSFEDNSVHLILYCDTQGQVLWGRCYDPGFNSPIRVPGVNEDRFHLFHPFLAGVSDSSLVVNCWPITPVSPWMFHSALICSIFAECLFI